MQATEKTVVRFHHKKLMCTVREGECDFGRQRDAEDLRPDSTHPPHRSHRAYDAHR